MSKHVHWCIPSLRSSEPLKFVTLGTGAIGSLLSSLIAHAPPSLATSHLYCGRVSDAPSALNGPISRSQQLASSISAHGGIHLVTRLQTAGSIAYASTGGPNTPTSVPWVPLASPSLSPAVKSVCSSSSSFPLAAVTPADAQPVACTCPVSPLTLPLPLPLPPSGSSLEQSLCSDADSGAIDSTAWPAADVAVIVTKGEHRLATAVADALQLIGYTAPPSSPRPPRAAQAGATASALGTARCDSQLSSGWAVATAPTAAAWSAVRRRGVILCLMNGAGHRGTIERAVATALGPGPGAGAGAGADANRAGTVAGLGTAVSARVHTTSDCCVSTVAGGSESGPIVLIGTTAMGALVVAPGPAPISASGSSSAGAPSPAPGSTSASEAFPPLVCCVTGWGDTVVAEPTAVPAAVTPAAIVSAVLAEAFVRCSPLARVSLATTATVPTPPEPSDAATSTASDTGVGGGVHASAGADTAPDDASPTVAALSAALLRLPQLPLSENAVVWRKLLANVVVNPVTALVSCANGALAPPLVTAAAPLAAAVGAATGAAAAAILDAAEAEEAAALARGGAAWLQNAGAGGAEQTVSAAFVRALVREALAVARTQDVRLFDPAPVPGAGAAPGATRLALAAALAAALDAVRVTCERTAGNRSSMRTDVEAGVAETEIGYLNAQVVEWGRLSGVPTPANAVVVDAIRAIERENAQKRTKTWV